MQAGLNQGVVVASVRALMKRQLSRFELRLIRAEEDRAWTGALTEMMEPLAHHAPLKQKASLLVGRSFDGGFENDGFAGAHVVRQFDTGRSDRDVVLVTAAGLILGTLA